ncbi:unnamed protein product [Pocillopora meandrina]|uniref:Uncharacterized protein n=1 Tax=Pocillopora meandrina TaxID=46732 RepID=A0AAU9WSK9_9CNID|nr:unnamed protein product [Pocillopora meandrina]
MYTTKTPNGIICGIQRHLDGTVGNRVLNHLDALDKEFVIFRRCLDAEIKDSTRLDLNLQIKKGDKEAVRA